MKTPTSLYLFVSCILIQITNAQFIGLGSRYGYPLCCFACRAVISGAMLSCTPPMDMSQPHSHGHSPTPPSCYATDDAFLTTLAYCISQRCEKDGLPTWEREKYWAMSATGNPAVPAKWDYSTAAQHVAVAPNATYIWGTELNQTSMVAQTGYEIQYRAAYILNKVSATGNKYILALIIISFGIPVLVTWISKLPYMTGIFDKLKPYLVFPSTIGSYHVRPLPWLLGNAPTYGQALYIFSFSILNLILIFAGYDSVAPLPHPWGYDRRGEWLAYAGYRTGDMAFALLPLTILFAGRNNILLWATNWSHSTYLLLHRWVARMLVLQTILHSVFLLVAYARAGSYPVESKQPYWLWGIVGTVFESAMPVFSILWARRLSYEIFLVYHIISTVFVIVGCWYHLVYRFGLSGSHEYWLYAACAVWFFDRLIRVLKIAKNGMRRAVVTELGDSHVRVDIQGLRFASKPGYHAYTYFPTLKPLKPWENHPFPVNATAIFASVPNQAVFSQALSQSTATSSRPSFAERNQDVEQNSEKEKPNVAQVTHVVPATNGITLIIRKNTGMTQYLKHHASLLTLIDGPYRNNTADEILKCDRILLIGGGIGITGLLSWATSHPNTKLLWSLKQSDHALMLDVEGAVDRFSEKEVLVGRKFDVKSVLEAEGRMEWKRVGVVVCGPGGLCDDVRVEVVRLRRAGKMVWELEVHAYSW